MCHTCNTSSRQEKRCRSLEPLIMRGSTGFWGSIFNININFKASYFKAEERRFFKELCWSLSLWALWSGGCCWVPAPLGICHHTIFPNFRNGSPYNALYSLCLYCQPRATATPQVCSCAKWSPRLGSSKGKPCGIGIYPQNAIFAKLSQKKKKKLFSPQISPDWAVCGCTAAQDTSQKNI